MMQLPVPVQKAPSPRPVRRAAALRASGLLLVAALLLPVALLPLSRLVPTLGMEAKTLSEEAATAAGRVAEALAAQPDPAAALAAIPVPTGLRLALVGPDGRIMARAGAEAEQAGETCLVAEQGVEGTPLLLRATRAAAPPAAGLVPLGAAVLAMLLLALLARQREARAAAAAAEEERRDALRTAALAESEAQLRLALAAAALGCWSWDEASDRIDWDAQAAAILGWCPAGQPGGAALRDCVDPADLPQLDAALDQTRRNGEAATCELRLRTAPESPPRWVELHAQARRRHGTITWHGVISDITARRHAEEQQRLLLREVDHRAKNTLAVVQALLRLTRTEDPASFLPRVEARIAALSRAHTLLARARWRGIDLHQLVEAEMVRHGAPEAARHLGGPPVTLAAIATQPMAMVLHELASNAGRHGALARPDGALSLNWRLLPDGGLELAWQERQPGPVRGGTARGGLGTRIMDATVRDQLGGSVARDWTPEGLRCTIRLPVACVLASPTDRAEKTDIAA
ncbi:HWE histidine kinase domain-containing protein [Roseicella aquatilis]|uniref:histidine kinase n=1 Tax=Roseicella aquatilis TaxID=2527868 RepID=A0A4R4DU41_9PROT|nr:HWE histidine kinase domain-containing protein [Roseicella aquatilis]TCZ65538.1 PAS domain S-box protein [Roseicella aquatilis]